jgi:hypothetical protein
MNTINLIAQDLFDKVRSRFTNLELGDSNGSVTTDPSAARFFDFDFVFEGNKLGRVSISINDQASLKIFYARNLVENADDQLVDIWYNFLREMRFFAKRRLLKFDTRDITKSNLDKNDFQYLASKGKSEETVQESIMFGSTKSSYLPLENTKLIIRHSKKVDETQRGSRSRNIHAIYVENADGERFRCPYNSLSLGKAMQRHVSNGGKPYDTVGESIIKVAEQINQLLKFKRHVGNVENLSEDIHEIVSRCSVKLESLRKELKSLSKQQYYNSWKNDKKKNQELIIDQTTLEDYKNKFTVSSFNEELAQYFPLVHAIMQETSELNLDTYFSEETTDTNTSEPVFKSWTDAANKWTKFREKNPIAQGIVSAIPGVGTVTKAVDAGAAAIKGNYKDAASHAVGFVPGLKHVNTAVSVGNVAKNLIPQKQPEKQFENWANLITDDKLADDVVADIKKLFDNELTIGLNGMNAIESLQNIGLDNNELFDIIKSIADKNKDSADSMPAEPAILLWLKDYDPEAFLKLSKDTNSSSTDDTNADSKNISESKKKVKNDIDEMILSFFNREDGDFPLGETGVITKVKKEFGEKFEPYITQKVRSTINKNFYKI